MATAGRCKMGKRSAANTVANPMLAADHLQGLVLEDVGDAHSAAAERAMQMVRDRHDHSEASPFGVAGGPFWKYICMSSEQAPYGR